MTSDLAQVALGFCQLCLGWERPVDRKYAEQNQDPYGKPSKAWLPYVFDFYGTRDQFHYTDLNAVIAAAREWSDKVEGSLILGYGRYAKGDWDASLTTSAVGELFLNRCPCHALMATCVEAARKLKAAA